MNKIKWNKMTESQNKEAKKEKLGFQATQLKLPLTKQMHKSG
jgi:hypothetical protein